MDTAEAIATRLHAPGAIKLPIAIQPLGTAQQNRQVRSLQVEIIGDQWKGFTPRIRIAGKWLERAGFKPGTRVSVACLAQGVIQLRCLPVGAYAPIAEVQNVLENPS